MDLVQDRILISRIEGVVGARKLHVRRALDVLAHVAAVADGIEAISGSVNHETRNVNRGEYRAKVPEDAVGDQSLKDRLRGRKASEAG